MAQSLPVVVVNTVCQFIADRVAPARVTVWLEWVTVSDLIDTPTTITSLGATENVLPVADTDVPVSVVSAPVETCRLHCLPEAIVHRDMTASMVEPPVSDIESVPVINPSAMRAPTLASIEPVSTPSATDPEEIVPNGMMLFHSGAIENGFEAT